MQQVNNLKTVQIKTIPATAKIQYQIQPDKKPINLNTPENLTKNNNRLNELIV